MNQKGNCNDNSGVVDILGDSFDSNAVNLLDWLEQWSGSSVWNARDIVWASIFHRDGIKYDPGKTEFSFERVEMREFTPEEAYEYTRDNPGSGVVGHVSYTDYEVRDRWGHVIGWVRKPRRLDEEEKEDV